MPGFPVLCGAKDGVCDPVQQPETDDRSKPEHQPMPSKPPPPPQSMQEHANEAASKPVEEAPPNWKKKKDAHGFDYWIDHDSKKVSYFQPEDWSEVEETSKQVHSQSSASSTKYAAFYLTEPATIQFLDQLKGEDIATTLYTLFPATVNSFVDKFLESGSIPTPRARKIRQQQNLFKNCCNDKLQQQFMSTIPFLKQAKKFEDIEQKLKQAEAEKPAEAEKQAEAAKQAEAEKQEKAEKQAEAAKQAEADKEDEIVSCKIISLNNLYYDCVLVCIGIKQRTEFFYLFTRLEV